jgi:hypothetical protein
MDVGLALLRRGCVGSAATQLPVLNLPLKRNIPPQQIIPG